jgi:glycosyltransferase involved in cell wall biosynthesis
VVEPWVCLVSADVCLLLEGTYPFVRGGVSSWVHQIISGLPELRFSLVFIGGSRRDYPEPRFELPKNVIHREAHYLEDALRDMKPVRPRSRPGTVEELRTFGEALARWRGTTSDDALDAALDRVLRTLASPGGISRDELMFGAVGWQLIRESYQRGFEGTPFIDYFWTARLMLGPVMQLAQIAERIPHARVYHTVSTGYAGLLGALLRARRRGSLVLTEHGIYTKERKIDLNHAEWLDGLRPRVRTGLQEGASLRQLWIRYFEALGRLTYRAADPIIALYGGNRARQQDDGADPKRTRVIVNGVDVDRFAPALRARGHQPPKAVGLIGRIVRIKDVKTFVRAMAVVMAAVPEAEGLIIGGSDEEPEYAEECQALVRDLGLAERVRFLGHQKVEEIFPRLGVLMLSSISEAQPLAVLEAFASGVPCVTTDVGACREQIEGLTDGDRALGRAGRVVAFADPQSLGAAAVELLTNLDTWRSCQRTALARVRAFYTQRAMLDSYRAIYTGAKAAA